MLKNLLAQKLPASLCLLSLDFLHQRYEKNNPPPQKSTFGLD